MSEYGSMKLLARAQLKQSNPKRFERIKAEHEHQEKVLTHAVKSAKTHAEYKAFKAELDLFNAGGDPWAVTESPTPPPTQPPTTPRPRPDAA